ncbi:MAG: hypothetical protein ACI9A7_002461 [Cyclobacteriaceae bacterium]
METYLPMRPLFIVLICANIFLINCEPFLPAFPDEMIAAMQPIYAGDFDFTIKQETRDSIYNVGRIFVYGDFLLVNDITDGIHVIDNQDPANPTKLYFINIPGNTDLSVKDNLIYADNHVDLVVLSINESGFELKHRVEKVFLEEGREDYPSQNDVYFECPNPEKGKVIGWRSTLIDSPQCYKNR